MGELLPAKAVFAEHCAAFQEHLSVALALSDVDRSLASSSEFEAIEPLRKMDAPKRRSLPALGDAEPQQILLDEGEGDEGGEDSEDDFGDEDV